MFTQKLLPIALILLGSLQMVGYLGQSPMIRSVGLALTASPLPLVFSHFRELETFATDFNVEVIYVDGTRISKRIDSSLYSKLLGPYNRRNTFGAVFAFGPKLTEPKEQAMVHSVLHYSFCKNGPLLTELGFAGSVDHAIMHIDSKADSTQKFRIIVRCTP